MLMPMLMPMPSCACVHRLQRLNPGTTAVSSVMTPNPDGGSPSMTVIEALQQVRSLLTSAVSGVKGQAASLICDFAACAVVGRCWP